MHADAELPVDEVLRVAGRGSAGTDVAGDSRLPRGGRRDAGRHRAGFLAGVPAPPHRRQGIAVPGRRLRAGELQLLRSEEHTSELQSLMRSSYAVFCLKKKNRMIFYIEYTL